VLSVGEVRHQAGQQGERVAGWVPSVEARQVGESAVVPDEAEVTAGFSTQRDCFRILRGARGLVELAGLGRHDSVATVRLRFARAPPSLLWVHAGATPRHAQLARPQIRHRLSRGAVNLDQGATLETLRCPVIRAAVVEEALPPHPHRCRLGHATTTHLHGGACPVRLPSTRPVVSGGGVSNCSSRAVRTPRTLAARTAPSPHSQTKIRRSFGSRLRQTGGTHLRVAADHWLVIPSLAPRGASFAYPSPPVMPVQPLTGGVWDAAAGSRRRARAHSVGSLLEHPTRALAASRRTFPPSRGAVDSNSNSMSAAVSLTDVRRREDFSTVLAGALNAPVSGLR